MVDIESYDLQDSTLVQLARPLDLELVLVPRKTVSDVQSIMRTDTGRAFPAGDSALAAYSLEHDDDG